LQSHIPFSLLPCIRVIFTVLVFVISQSFFFFFKIIRPGEGFGHHLWGKSSMYDLTRRNCPFMLFALVVSEKT